MIDSYIRNRIAMSNGCGYISINGVEMPVRITSMTNTPWEDTFECEVIREGVKSISFRPDNPITIDRVIFNDPATIVFWKDGSKTVVKCQKGDRYDPEKGLAMAMCKKALGNKGNYCNVFKEHCPKEVDDHYAKLREIHKALYSHMADVYTDTELEG